MTDEELSLIEEEAKKERLQATARLLRTCKALREQLHANLDAYATLKTTLVTKIKADEDLTKEEMGNAYHLTCAISDALESKSKYASQLEILKADIVNPTHVAEVQAEIDLLQA